MPPDYAPVIAMACLILLVVFVGVGVLIYTG
jgi:hypothetical protein